MFYVYILKSINLHIYYKGCTANLDRRLYEHFGGYSTTTKRLLPIKLIHVELCDTISEARKLEKYFKTGAGREIIKEIDSPGC